MLGRQIYKIVKNQCRHQSIQSKGANLKVGGAKSFLLILALEKHAVHNAVYKLK